MIKYGPGYIGRSFQIYPPWISADYLPPSRVCARLDEESTVFPRRADLHIKNFAFCWGSCHPVQKIRVVILRNSLIQIRPSVYIWQLPQIWQAPAASTIKNSVCAAYKPSLLKTSPTVEWFKVTFSYLKKALFKMPAIFARALRIDGIKNCGHVVFERENNW